MSPSDQKDLSNTNDTNYLKKVRVTLVALAVGLSENSIGGLVRIY